MNNQLDDRPNQQDWSELYDELAQERLRVLQMIARGLAGEKEALYVAETWGLTSQLKEKAHA